MSPAADVAPGPEPAADDLDEPPSPGPSGPASDPPLTILTADERADDPRLAVPVDLEVLAGLLAHALVAEGVPAGAEASLTLVDPDAIAALKTEHLDGDGSPTDVLSFPIDGRDGPGGAPGCAVDPADWLVGDVVLCPAVAARQAPEHAGSVDDELALLVVHSALHLTGWDHATDADRDAMWARERHLLSELHHEPVNDPWSGPPR